MNSMVTAGALPRNSELSASLRFNLPRLTRPRLPTVQLPDRQRGRRVVERVLRVEGHPGEFEPVAIHRVDLEEAAFAMLSECIRPPVALTPRNVDGRRDFVLRPARRAQ